MLCTGCECINNIGPFNAAVWGNVSDWVMVIVTAITAGFVWWTLDAQRAMLEIEQSRRLTEARPKFAATATSWLNTQNKMILRIDVYLKKNDAKQVNIDFSEENTTPPNPLIEHGADGLFPQYKVAKWTTDNAKMYVFESTDEVPTVEPEGVRSMTYTYRIGIDFYSMHKESPQYSQIIRINGVLGKDADVTVYPASESGTT